MDRAGTGLGVPGTGTQSSDRFSSHGGLVLPIAGFVLHGFHSQHAPVVVVNGVWLLQGPPQQNKTEPGLRHGPLERMNGQHSKKADGNRQGMVLEMDRMEGVVKEKEWYSSS